MNTVFKTFILFPDLIIVLFFCQHRHSVNLILSSFNLSGDAIDSSLHDSLITGRLFMAEALSNFLIFLPKHNVLSGTLMIHSKIAERLKHVVETFALHILPKSYLNFKDQYLVFVTICYLEKRLLELQIPKLRGQSVSIANKLFSTMRMFSNVNLYCKYRDAARTPANIQRLATTFNGLQP